MSEQLFQTWVIGVGFLVPGLGIFFYQRSTKNHPGFLPKETRYAGANLEEAGCLDLKFSMKPGLEAGDPKFPK